MTLYYLALIGLLGCSLSASVATVDAVQCSHIARRYKRSLSIAGGALVLAFSLAMGLVAVGAR